MFYSSHIYIFILEYKVFKGKLPILSSVFRIKNNYLFLNSEIMSISVFGRTINEGLDKFGL